MTPITDEQRLRTLMLACSVAQVRIVGIHRAEAPFGDDTEPGWWIPSMELIVLNHIVDAATLSLQVLDSISNNLWQSSLGAKAAMTEGPRPFVPMRN